MNNIKKYALIKNGVVSNVVVAEDEWVLSVINLWDKVLEIPENQSAGEGWVWNETDGFIAPAIPELVVENTWKITKLAFKNRFPRAKWIAAKSNASTDENLADFFETFDLSTFIDLQRQDTINSVNTLMDVTIPESFRLTQEEVDAVLLVPAQPNEIPS